MVRKAASSARHPSLIEMQGLLRIAGILATQGHDHCKHAMVGKATSSARHPSLIEMQGLLPIAGILATQIDR